MAKRLYGSGSVRARLGVQGVRFQASYRHDGARFSETFSSRRAAETWLARQQAAAAEGRLNLPSSLTVGQLFDYWLEVRGPKLAPRTRATYASCAKLSSPLHKARAQTVRPDQIDRLLNGLLKQGYAPKTVDLVRTVLHNAYRSAVKWRLLAVNPVTATDAIEIPLSEPPHLTREQSRALLGAIGSDRLAALWVLAIGGGLRSGELRGLQLSDIDRDNGLLIVRRSLSQQRTQIGPTKSRRERALPLVPALLAVLDRHEAIRTTERLLAGLAWQDSEYLFTRENGRPLSGEALRRSFRAVLKRAGLPETLGPHACRHAFASAGPRLNISPRIIQRFLGHASLEQTMQYTHVAAPEEVSALTAIFADLGIGVPDNRSVSD